jgi:hypothetical protein
MKKWSFLALLLIGATILGSTVLREPIASAAQSVDANIIGPLDGQGNVKVHEQGTANVAVNGSVAVRPAIPANEFNNSDTGNTDLCPNLPAGTRWYLSSLSATNTSGFAGAVHVFLQGADGTANGPVIAVEPATTSQLTFPVPFILAQGGDNWCLHIVSASLNCKIVG